MMKHLVLVVTIVVSLTVLASGPVAADEPSGAIGRVEELGRVLRQHDAWRAEYTQTYLAPGMSLGEEAVGAVWVAWPDRARFSVTEGTAQEMGLQGRWVRLVDPLTPSCEDHLLDEDEWARIPLSVVLDPRAAVARFAVDDLGDDGFVLLPREPGGVDRVEVRLGGDRMPREIVVVDPQGARNRLRFEAWRESRPPPDGWLPDAPEGAPCAAPAVG